VKKIIGFEEAVGKTIEQVMGANDYGEYVVLHFTDGTAAVIESELTDEEASPSTLWFNPKNRTLSIPDQLEYSIATQEDIEPLQNMLAQREQERRRASAEIQLARIRKDFLELEEMGNELDS